MTRSENTERMEGMTKADLEAVDKLLADIAARLEKDGCPEAAEIVRKYITKK